MVGSVGEWVMELARSATVLGRVGYWILEAETLILTLTLGERKWRGPQL